ncbi:hypothetical protein KTE49_11930 [Burkholderia multivorans]|uniref:chromosome partitioning protein ParB n=1 Tax=Burkholderia multivorans TaxID=87883 RepID=UPI000D00C977|nr:chromosome partitioning protein ParB [Burkholderia multivorans]MBJ9616270.1 hypothetical protein [Burkholderia multivorans]MBU9330151.1 hypothetical protein [Burkholderia multivorans]MBU9395265.1 hypothetical protein [Burkholderia multivorans]MBU9531141.1 hypothetical protein [Burkholderia multivorans]MDR8786687.1 hypothetical protein [Burkholderia multivorans]
MKFKAQLRRSTPGCPVELLQFDGQNPRLEDGRDRSLKSDAEIIKSLREVAALGELINSICANTYLDIEPLIVIGEDETGPFTVLEGNRRLASIKLIRDPELAAECKITIPEVSDEVMRSTDTVTVYRVGSIEEARAFIGFKHINGPHRWESFAKAKFVTNWYKAGRDAGLTIDDIARELGDDNKTIRNMIAGMLTLEQAEQNGFSIQDKYARGRFGFSHLYTALSRGEYQDFLGLKKGWSQHPEDNPVPESHIEQLNEIMLWLYGSKARDKAPLIRSQNPDLADLGDVLKNRVALATIRANGTLAQALVEIKPVNTLLADSMVEANAKLRESVSLAARADKHDESLYEIAKQIQLQARSLFTLLSGLVDVSNKEIGESE